MKHPYSDLTYILLIKNIKINIKRITNNSNKQNIKSLLPILIIGTKPNIAIVINNIPIIKFVNATKIEQTDLFLLKFFFAK